MTFNEWFLLTQPEREAESQTWHIFEPGYWHSIATEAAARFAAEYGSSPHVLRVCKSLYRANDLVIAVQTDVSPAEKLPLPDLYEGFKVVQFAGRIPEGVLVDVGPPGSTVS